MNVKRFLAAAALAAFALTAAALPTVDAVQAQVQSGNYVQAEKMMQEVINAKPGSARAHYIYAEILAHNRHFDEAAKQAASAAAIDPAIGFTDPAKFRALQQLLAREQRAAKPALDLAQPVAAMPQPAARVEPAAGIPGWVWMLGLGAIAVFAWSRLRRRQAAAPFGAAPAGFGAGPASGAYGAAPAYGPGYAPMPAQAPGSGLLGVGLAAAGGVAAGMLAEKMLEGHREPSWGASAGNPGLSPGLLDNPAGGNDAARELEERPVDFGSGDGWGGGDDASSGGSGGTDDW